MESLREMFAYWHRPQFLKVREPLTSKTLLELGRILAFTLGGVFTLMLVTGLIFHLFNIPRVELSQDFGNMISKPQFLFMAVILAPLIEELLFRSWMGIKWGILIVLPFLLWGVSLAIFVSEKSLAFQYDVMCMAAISALLIVYGRAYWRTAKLEHHHEKAVERVFPFIFWVTAAVFGLVHLSNFKLENIGLLGVIIILPQFFVGAVLGYVRMRYGFISAILFHAGYNGILISLSLLATASS